MDLEVEQLLIKEVQAHPEQFGRLFDEFYPRILNYCIKRIGDVTISEDITSEVFIKAFKNVQKFEWRNITFSAWLYRIALNEISTYFRKKQPISLDILIEEQGFDPADKALIRQEIIEGEIELERHEEFLSVQSELQKLPLKYQEVLSLRYFEDKKIYEIAEILGKKEGTVKSLLSRGLDKLSERVKSSKVQQIE